MIKEFVRELSVDKHDLIQFFCALMMLLAACLVFVDSDCVAYTQWSINIWDALVEGRISEYFLVTAENVRSSYYGGNSYGILYLLPWAIWNFPIWLTHYFGDALNIKTTFCIFWSQLFLVFWAMIAGVFTAKIVYYFTNKKKAAIRAFIFLLASGTLFVSVGYFGQDEIEYVAFFMIGVYYLVVKNKVHGYIALGISVILCNLMLIPAVVLILFYEKNLIKLLIFILGSLLPEKIVSYFCGYSQVESLVNSSNYKMGQVFTLRTYCDWFFNSSLRGFGIGNVSIFIVIVVLICVRAYFYTNENVLEIGYKALCYTCGCFLLALCICAWEHGYRYVICVPILVCTTIISENKQGDNGVALFLITIWELLYTYIACANARVLSFGSTKLDEIVENHASVDQSVYTLILKYLPEIELLYTPVVSCFVALSICLIAYIVIDRQKSAISFSSSLMMYIHCLIPVLMFVAYCWCYINMFTVEYETLDSLSIAINGNNSIYQEYEAIGKRLDFIEVRSITWGRQYIDDLYLKVDLIDGENEEILDTRAVWANAFEDGGLVRIIFNQSVEQGKTYYFHFYLDNYLKDENQWIYLGKSSEVTAKKYLRKAYIEENGAISDSTFYNVVSVVSERL